MGPVNSVFQKEKLPECDLKSTGEEHMLEDGSKVALRDSCQRAGDKWFCVLPVRV